MKITQSSRQRCNDTLVHPAEDVLETAISEAAKENVHADSSTDKELANLFHLWEREFIEKGALLDRRAVVCFLERQLAILRTEANPNPFCRVHQCAKEGQKEGTCETCGRWDSNLIEGMCMECLRRITASDGWHRDKSLT